jgi:outer membrane biosynthesis protein TonB
VNKRALKIPKPIINFECNCTGEVIVEIKVDMDGNLKSARAISGHPLLRKACVISARNATYPPTVIHGETFLIRAKLVYKFKPDGTIEF